MISADVFEQIFQTHLGQVFDLEIRPLDDWCDLILGEPDKQRTLDDAADYFFTETSNADFFCPAYECIPLSPLFIALRNLRKARVRLLFVGHAPGAYVLEWYLLRPLLVPGDLIIAPSECAKKTIEFLCPGLSPFIRVIHHPMHRLKMMNENGNKNGNRLVTLGRIEDTKLIHRQIEALRLLHRKGYTGLNMDIAGPIRDTRSGEIFSYVRTLQNKIRRFNLEESVRFVGPVTGDVDKAAFLDSASMSLNLSVSIEEAYPKATIEALGMGIPVIATRWNGMPETVGKGGILVPVYRKRNGHVDVKPESVARAVESLLKDPIHPEICIEQASKFLPSLMVPLYQAVVNEALISASRQTSYPRYDGHKHDHPEDGLFSRTALLKSFSYSEVFGFYTEYIMLIRKKWVQPDFSDSSIGERIHFYLLTSVKKAVEHFLGKLPCDEFMEHRHIPSQLPESLEFMEKKMLQALYSDANQSSRDVCLLGLYGEGFGRMLQKTWEFLKPEHVSATSYHYFKIQGEIAVGNYERAYALFNEFFDIDKLDEDDAVNLDLLAILTRKWGKPDLALLWVRTWLTQYPDATHSGSIWLARTINCMHCGIDYIKEAFESIEIASEIYGDNPIIEKLRNKLTLIKLNSIHFTTSK
ncbi:MAG: glycosyltransferase family 4 protein [Deltaproteobacteria bacterium]|nr:glycosyltransferase family 4 protein [Deltaproteobacteria bacterium]